jgi:hypothetical protein
MTVLVENLRPGVGVALDLLVGAGAAYAAAIRANRILSGAAAYLHGVCVAVLIQAIAFVVLILVSQQSQSPTVIQVGPIPFASVTPLAIWWRQLASAALTRPVVDTLPLLALLTLLLASFALAVAAPRWLRRRVT